jgi:uncharacterized membrane protein
MAAAPAEAHREAPKRSLVKAVSWRITGSIDTFILSWIFTGDPKIAGTIASVEVFTKIALFYFHERLWMRISWGQKITQDYHI